MRLLIYIPILLLALVSCRQEKLLTEKPPKKELSGYDKRKFEYLYIDGLKEKMLGNFSDALEKFQRCIQLNPSAPAPYYEIAAILHNSGRANEAVEFAKKAMGLDPSNHWYLLLTGECYKTSGQLSAAADLFEKGVKLFPGHTQMYLELANAYVLMGKYDDAVRAYDKLEEKAGVNEEVSIAKHKIWLRAGKPEKAIAELDKLVSVYPNEVKYYLMIGAIYSKQGDARAIDYFNKALAINPSSGMARLQLHDHYYFQNEPEKAFQELKLAFRSEEVSVDTKTRILLEYYERSLKNSKMKAEADTLLMIMKESNPNDARTFTVLGDFYYRDKKYPEALDAFSKALELDASRYAIWHQVMVLQSQLDLFNEMKETSAEAMNLFPLEPAPYLFNGVALIQQKKYKEAATVLKTGKEYVIENPELKSQFYSYLGEASYKDKEYKEAFSWFDKALDEDPNNVTVLNNYAYYLSLRGENLEKAEKMSQKANEIDSSSASYQDTYGWVLYKLGKYSEARTWIEKAIKTGGENNSTILEHLGDVLFKLGEPLKAVEYWEKAKKAGKGSELLDKKLNEKKLFE